MPHSDRQGVQDLTDAELVGLMAQGDQVALREFYERNRGWLTARLRRRCADPDLVAEALQDTFVAVWRQASRYRGTGEVGAWTWGIAVRRLISLMRGRHGEPPVQPDAPVNSAEDQVMLNLAHSDMAPALASLSPQMRAVIQACVMDGLTAKEAGVLLGIPTNTVKTRLHRAKAHLRQELAGGVA
jgi:RNA polymerase sigma factor (sigma-70 family)